MSQTSTNQEEFCAQAQAAGFEVVEPDASGKMLLVDLDGGLDDFVKRLGMIHEIEPVIMAKVKPSKTTGHYHAIVTMSRPFPFAERQMLELMLGDDPYRAIHNLRHTRGCSKHPALLSTVKGPWMEWSVSQGKAIDRPDTETIKAEMATDRHRRRKCKFSKKEKGDAAAYARRDTSQ